MRMSLHRLAAALGLLALTATAAGAARADAAIEQGRALAQRHCARCHAISGPGPSQVRKAPPFSGLARRWSLEDIAEALAEGIVVGHGTVRMPEFAFEAAQIDNLLAYLGSVQR